jgi:hypothetical protein
MESRIQFAQTLASTNSSTWMPTSWKFFHFEPLECSDFRATRPSHLKELSDFADSESLEMGSKQRSDEDPFCQRFAEDAILRLPSEK